MARRRGVRLAVTAELDENRRLIERGFGGVRDRRERYRIGLGTIDGGYSHAER